MSTFESLDRFMTQLFASTTFPRTCICPTVRVTPEVTCGLGMGPGFRNTDIGIAKGLFTPKGAVGFNVLRDGKFWGVLVSILLAVDPNGGRAEPVRSRAELDAVGRAYVEVISGLKGESLALVGLEVFDLSRKTFDTTGDALLVREDNSPGGLAEKDLKLR